MRASCEESCVADWIQADIFIIGAQYQLSVEEQYAPALTAVNSSGFSAQRRFLPSIEPGTYSVCVILKNMKNPSSQKVLGCFSWYASEILLSDRQSCKVWSTSKTPRSLKIFKVSAVACIIWILPTYRSDGHVGQKPRQIHTKRIGSFHIPSLSRTCFPFVKCPFLPNNRPTWWA